MGLHSPRSFEDDVRQSVYEYVERHGAASPAELARSVRIEDEPPQSKPARSGTDSPDVLPSRDALEAAIEGLKREGHLVETDGKLRLALEGPPIEREVDEGTVTIRPAREEDRAGLIAAMRAVGSEGPYVVAEDVADHLEGEPALVRVDEERSRVFFVAVLERESADSERGRDEERAAVDPTATVVGWLHVDAPELPSLCHTAELTVGVVPDHRREGIGSALLEYGLDWAEGEYRKVYQSVPATNERAIAFLEETGWTREGEREEHYRIDDEFVDEVQFAIWP